MISGSINVGTRVRVQSPDGQVTSRAIVSFINDDGTYDIVYHANNSEESSIPVSRLQPLEGFEHDLESGKRFGASLRKEYGNTLFKLKDIDAAVEMYKSVLCEISEVNRISVGSRVLVANGNGDFNPGIVSGVEHGASFEVLYDDEMFEDESNVHASRISIIATQLSTDGGQDTECVPCGDRDRDPLIEAADLQRAVYMNLARCAMKKIPPQPGWATRWSSLAIATSRYLMDHIRSSGGALHGDGSSYGKQLADAYYLRSKAFVAASRPQLARKDAITLQPLDPSKATSLLSEIDSFLTKRQKSNRKLARDVARWVETAMQINAEKQAAGGRGGGRGDVDVDVDDIAIDFAGEEEDD